LKFIACSPPPARASHTTRTRQAHSLPLDGWGPRLGEFVPRREREGEASSSCSESERERRAGEPVSIEVETGRTEGKRREAPKGERR